MGQPRKQINSLLPAFISDFIATESAAGIVMIVVAACALVVANSSLAAWYQTLIATPITLGHGTAVETESASAWIKDILMVFFFLIVGMELKREMREGFLAKRAQILLPLLAAIGGMAVPALIFLALNASNASYAIGWAIPSATDIAFALCVLALAGSGVPRALKIFLLAIAIFDDLGAIIIIAAFYGSPPVMVPLLLAAVGLGALAVLNWRKITAIMPYLLVGVYLWFCLHMGGVHTTVAGVAVGMAIPMRGRNGQSPLNAFLHWLHPWVSFLVLPLFAFTSAGINFADIQLADLLQPLPLGIALGLFAGKQIGIFGVTWLLIKTKLVPMPQGVRWVELYGVSVIAGIGFTMSLFIDLLAFSDSTPQDLSKIGIIGGSLLSALWGFAVLKYGASLQRRSQSLLKRQL